LNQCFASSPSKWFCNTFEGKADMAYCSANVR
jgi:hypothetical protein